MKKYLLLFAACAAFATTDLGRQVCITTPDSLSKQAEIHPDSLASVLTSNRYSTQIFHAAPFVTKWDDNRNVILVDADSGKILYEKNAYKVAEIASLTKMMTMLLFFEDLDKGKVSLKDMVTASKNSCKIGGSQIFLKENEQISVRDLAKAMVMRSANDATYLLAEYLADDHLMENFIKRMNERARQLGMNNTVYYYPHGLPASAKDRKEKHIKGNLSTAYDLVLLTEELLKHKKVTEFTSCQLDTIRVNSPGFKPFVLTSTNKLLKENPFVDGMKTGFYYKAGFCLVSTAKKDGRRLIGVILGCKDKNWRTRYTNDLLNWGFNEIDPSVPKTLFADNSFSVTTALREIGADDPVIRIKSKKTLKSFKRKIHKKKKKLYAQNVKKKKRARSGKL